jgi:hypothetical protein
MRWTVGCRGPCPAPGTAADETARPLRRRLLLVALVCLLDTWLLAGCGWARAQAARPAPAGARRLTLTVKEPAGVARAHWPVTAGVPFPQGRVREVAALRLTSDTPGGGAMPLQASVLSRWPDGSVRWALLDWRADLRAGQERRFHVDTGAPSPAAETRGADHAGVTVRDAGDRFEVDSGPLQFAVPKTRFAIIEQARLNSVPVTAGAVVSFLDIGGQRIAAQAPARVSLTEAGPQRARIELRGHFGAAFDYVVRIDAFAGQAFVRVLHSVEQHNPEPYTFVRQIGIDLPLAFSGTPTYTAGGAGPTPLSGTLPPQGFSLVQEDNDTFRVDDTRQAGHAAGWIDLHDAARGLAIVARYFWQEYPQSFQVRATGLTYNLWAPEAGPAKVGMGAAKTHEMVFLFHGQQAPAAAALAAFTQPVLARLDPQWIVSTRALRNAVQPSAATTPFLRDLGAAYGRYQQHADAERWDDSGQVACPRQRAAGAAAPAERPRHGFYGMFNWGDWNYPGYHDTTKGCDAWGNLEYDLTQVLALAYAATGERAVFDGMVAAARHFTDVDHIYYARDHPAIVGMNHPKNPLHFTFERGGVDLGHTWTEGLLSYYYLTGDARSLDAARGIANYLVQRLHGSLLLISNPRQFGWPQIALVAAYEATGDERYKAAAIDYAQRGMRAHPPDRVGRDRAGGWKMGILAEAIAYTHSISGDAAMREWLTRYAAAVQARGVTDPRYFPALAYVGRIAAQPQATRAARDAVARLKFGSWAKPFTIAGRLGFAVLSQLPEMR